MTTDSKADGIIERNRPGQVEAMMNRWQTRTIAAFSGTLFVLLAHVAVAGGGPDEFLVLENNVATLSDDGNGGTLNNLRRVIVLQNYGPPQLRFTDTSFAVPKVWHIGHYFGNKFRIDTPSSAGVTDLELDGRGNMTVPGIVNQGSSRAVKTGFAAIDPVLVLGRVVKLPITSWRYKADSDTALHLGPVAEDFHAAFSLGSDNKHIASSDAAGVALAAIQGLHRLVDGQREELVQLEDRNRILMEQMEELVRVNAQLAERLDVIEQENARTGTDH